MTLHSRSRKTWRIAIPQPLSEGEETLALHLHGLKFEREYKFSDSRNWRADFAFPAAKLLIEVEGGTNSNGRHNRAQGYARDLEKYNAATALGWALLRNTTTMVTSGRAEREIRAYLSVRGVG